jgi:hypothetical protein
MISSPQKYFAFQNKNNDKCFPTMLAGIGSTDNWGHAAARSGN